MTDRTKTLLVFGALTLAASAGSLSAPGESRLKVTFALLAALLAVGGGALILRGSLRWYAKGPLVPATNLKCLVIATLILVALAGAWAGLLAAGTLQYLPIAHFAAISLLTLSLVLAFRIPPLDAVGLSIVIASAWGLPIILVASPFLATMSGGQVRELLGL